MTSKDYELISKVIRANLDFKDRTYLVECFIPVLRENNEMFSASKFRKACRVKGGYDD